MKKPNITRGNWNNEVDVIYSDKEWLVADCSYIKGRDIDVINAKAISAVPDMIDALIQSTDELKHLYNILEIDADKTFTVKQNKKALKKAGCTE